MVASVVGGGGGLEYEEGTFFLSNTATSRQITFTNSHTSPPALVMAESTTSTSTSYSTFAMCIVYGLLFGAPRGGNDNYYAQKISGRGTTSSMSVIASATSDGMPINGITSSSVLLAASSNYPMAIGTWKWIAIWAPEN